ncbi:hypothetical protein [Sorangium sp. So ce385]|uniref:hypothetical protein n=1 Tax=Sorangium sp. So ce385 TaxID=3133308 RepID=UPI003F5BAE3E
MPKTKPAAKRASATPAPERLGPGLSAATIEVRAGDAFRIRTTGGVRARAVLGDDVDPALADECLRTGRLVIACDTERGPTIVGALQTRAPAERDDDGLVSLRAKDIKIRADRTLAIEAGPFTLRVDRAGVARLEGHRMVIDMSEIIRLLAARVELP